MTLLDRASDPTTFQPVCALPELTPDRGVAALLDGVAVAVFLLSDGTVHAVGNIDPFSGASVLSRAIVGDVDGTPTIASPLYKQRFDLTTGRCLDGDAVVINVYDARVDNGVVSVRVHP